MIETLPTLVSNICWLFGEAVLRYHASSSKLTGLYACIQHEATYLATGRGRSRRQSHDHHPHGVMPL